MLLLLCVRSDKKKQYFWYICMIWYEDKINNIWDMYKNNVGKWEYWKDSLQWSKKNVNHTHILHIYMHIICIYIHYMYICIYIYIYTSHIQIYLSTLHMCVCIHTCIATQTCIQSYIHACIHTYGGLGFRHKCESAIYS